MAKEQTRNKDDWQQCMAALDNLISQIFQNMNGKVFDMEDYKVGETAPPFHPNCRSTTVPYFEDEFTEGEQGDKRDGNGETYYVPADMKYEGWQKRFVKIEPETKKYTNIAYDDIMETDTERIYTFIEDEHYDAHIDQH